jgi:formylglycine-generating enzyme required for sulfatase activity
LSLLERQTLKRTQNPSSHLTTSTCILYCHRGGEGYAVVRAVVALLVLLIPSVAQAEKRLALLIGNESYSAEIGRLSNPHNDVALLEKALKGLGFEVVVARDAGLGALTTAINAYARRVQAAGSGAIGFFYYSGHGASDGSTNYLIPVDVKTTEAGELWDQSLRLPEITRKLKAEAGNATHFVVFDACRNTLRLTQPGTRAIVQSKGFVPVAQENGMLIAYATAEGELASDVGSGAGPYAKALAEEIVKPGIEAVVMFRVVQRHVRAAIRQEPYLGFNALGDVYFAGKPDSVVSTGEAERTWAWMKNTTDQALLENFIKQFGDTSSGTLARSRLEQLKNQQIAVPVPPASKPDAPLTSPREEHPAVPPALPPRASVTGSNGAQLFSGNCSVCHRGSENLAKGKSVSELTTFLGQHYTTSHENAAILAAYLLEQGSAQKPIASIDPKPILRRCDGIAITVGQSERRCFKPGAGKTKYFKDCPTCPAMVVVPAGAFTMGSPGNEPERINDNNEEAQVRVSIAVPFAVGKFAVTFDECDACVVDGGCNGYKPADEGWGRGKHPVINVSWDDSKTFATWLSRKTGKTYRLLSEAEREYVTRAGTTTPFWWGSSITPKQANYEGSAKPYKGGGSKGEDRERTVLVDSFAANPWGLYQVHGNVLEWTEDCINLDNDNNPGNGSARTTGDCSRRVVRGGSWGNPPQSLRAASRGAVITGAQSRAIGFRVARTLDP